MVGWISVKYPPAVQETWVPSPGREDTLEKGMLSALVLLLGWESHGQRSLAGYSPQGRKESAMTNTNMKIPKYSYEQPLIWFPSPLSASALLLSCPAPDPHPRSRCKDLSFFPSQLFSSEPSHACPSPQNTHSLPIPLLSPLPRTNAHPSFRAGWKGTPPPPKKSLRSPQGIFFLLLERKCCPTQREGKWIPKDSAWARSKTRVSWRQNREALTEPLCPNEVLVFVEWGWEDIMWENKGEGTETEGPKTELAAPASAELKARSPKETRSLAILCYPGWVRCKLVNPLYPWERTNKGNAFLKVTHVSSLYISQCPFKMSIFSSPSTSTSYRSTPLAEHPGKQQALLTSTPAALGQPTFVWHQQYHLRELLHHSVSRAFVQTCCLSGREVCREPRHPGAPRHCFSQWMFCKDGPPSPAV